MRYKATLVPSGRIVRDPKLTVRLNRADAQSERIVTVQTPAPGIGPAPEIPRGVDRWYDSLRSALIEWYPYRSRISADTPNWQNGAYGAEYTVDDDYDYEHDVAGRSWGSDPDARSAWWAIRVPADVPVGALLTMDNFLSTVGPDNPEPEYQNDLILSLVTTDIDPIPAINLPSPDFDFSDLYEVAFSDDIYNIVTREGFSYKSLIYQYAVEPGRTYWVRVATYRTRGDNRDQVTYRLRVTIDIPS